MASKNHEKIDTEKVSKNDANNTGTWIQNDDENGYKNKAFREKVILRKLLFPEEKQCFFMFRGCKKRF